MEYFDRLHPWMVVRLLPTLQRITLARHRRRSDAEAQIRVLEQMSPRENFAIVFDPPTEAVESTPVCQDANPIASR